MTERTTARTGRTGPKPKRKQFIETSNQDMYRGGTDESWHNNVELEEWKLRLPNQMTDLSTYTEAVLELGLKPFRRK